MKYEVEVTDRGSEFWRYEGKLHRIGGPAIKYADGSEFWHENGLLHRTGGLPAVKCADGHESYWENGKLHRTGGLPAVKRKNGDEEWWENGIRITKEEALRRASPPPPLPEYTMAELQELVGHAFKIVKEGP